MHSAGKTLCPFCSKEIPEEEFFCRICGQNLHPMIPIQSQAHAKADPYQIVPEGEQYAIAIRGEVEVHGLNPEDLAKAQTIVAILNSVIEIEKAG